MPQQSGDVGGLLALPKEIAAAVGTAIGAFSMGSVAPRLDTVLGPVEKFAKSFVTALTGILEPFKQITELATTFVSELDPALVRNLSDRFRDLNATIGIALRPIVDVARDVVKQLSDYLLPVMRKLEPIVRELAEAVGNELVDGFNQLGVLLDDMMPLFHTVKDVVIGFMPILHDLATLLKMFREVFQAMIKELFNAIMGGGGGGAGGGVKGAMEALRKAIQDVIKAIVQFLAQVFTLIGWVKGLEALKKALEPPRAAAREDANGVAVAMNPMFRAIGEMSKSLDAAMFAASDIPGGKLKGVERSNELLEGVEKAIKDGIDQGKANQEWFNGKVQEVKREIADAKLMITGAIARAEGVLGQVGDFARGARGAVNAVGEAQHDAENWARRQLGRPMKVREGGG